MSEGHALITGIVFTTTVDVDADDEHPAALVAVTVYTPAAAVVTEDTEVFWDDAVKLFGPVQA